MITVKASGKARRQRVGGSGEGGLDLEPRTRAVGRRGATAEATSGVARGVPRRALADGVVERRRTPRRPAEGAAVLPASPQLAPEELERLPALLSPEEHYRREQRRRADRVAGDLASLLAEAKVEYEALINAPRPAGKGGRPKKKPKPELEEEDSLDEE